MDVTHLHFSFVSILICLRLLNNGIRQKSRITIISTHMNIEIRVLLMIIHNKSLNLIVIISNLIPAFFILLCYWRCYVNLISFDLVIWVTKRFEISMELLRIRHFYFRTNRSFYCYQCIFWFFIKECNVIKCKVRKLFIGRIFRHQVQFYL
jgi:hypothetical protein